MVEVVSVSRIPLITPAAEGPAPMMTTSYFSAIFLLLKQYLGGRSDRLALREILTGSQIPYEPAGNQGLELLATRAGEFPGQSAAENPAQAQSVR